MGAFMRERLIRSNMHFSAFSVGFGGFPSRFGGSRGLEVETSHRWRIS